jgi:hypothetical protein
VLLRFAQEAARDDAAASGSTALLQMSALVAIEQLVTPTPYDFMRLTFR